jgi:hypothetical protein
VPALLEREDALGVVCQLTHEQDPQPVWSARGVGPLAEATVTLDLVDRVADRRVHSKRLGDAIPGPVRIETAQRLAQLLR